jgi:hypothetical protein
MPLSPAAVATARLRGIREARQGAAAVLPDDWPGTERLGRRFAFRPFFNLPLPYYIVLRMTLLRFA